MTVAMEMNFNSVLRVAWVMLVAVVFCLVPTDAGAQSVGSQIIGKWTGNVGMPGFSGMEGLGESMTEYDFDGNEKGGTVAVTLILSFSQPVSEKLRISGTVKFASPGTWGIEADGVYIFMKNAEAKMQLTDFDMKPVDESDAKTVAAIAKMKSDGFLKEVENKFAQSILKRFSEEFDKDRESHLVFMYFKIAVGVMTFTEAEMGDMTLKRVGD